VLDPNCLVLYRLFTTMLIWSVFLIFPKCLFVIIVIHAGFIHISQGSVKMHLRCGGTYINHITANCPQSVSAKEFWKSVNNWQIWTKVKYHVFYGPPCRWSVQHQDGWTTTSYPNLALDILTQNWSRRGHLYNPVSHQSNIQGSKHKCWIMGQKLLNW